MKKLVLMFSALFSAGTFVAKAQDVPMAILYSDTTAIFYGDGAFTAACDSAKYGDVITLSAGKFTLPNKIETGGLTIRGAGMEYNADANVGATYLTANGGSCTMPSHNMIFEGLHLGLNLILESWGITKFIKCKINKIGRGGTDSFLQDALFLQCKILDMDLCYNSKVDFVNTYIGNLHIGSNATVSLTNCIVANHTSGYGGNWSANNSILSNMLSKSIVYNNCIYIGEDTDFFSTQVSSTNVVLPNYTSLFKTFDGVYSDEETFELTDDSKSKYLGADGTQVGLYGGDFTYTPEVSYPHVIKKNIAVQTENGMLKVNVTIGVGDKTQDAIQP